jgi:hypothetical protein
VTGGSPDTEYWIDLRAPMAPVRLLAPVAGQGVKELPQVPDAKPIFQGRAGTNGQQIRGGTDRVPTAVVQFKDVHVSPDEQGNAAFELRGGIEHSGEENSETDRPTEVSIRVHNPDTQAISDAITVEPESNRTVLFKVPASQLSSGNFDLLVQCRTTGDFLGLQNRSIVLVKSTQPFAFNLAKSLAILWLMSVLITAVAIFCSTFLSWPIAVVLTIVILLGHWGVQQLGDATQPGIGNQVVTDFGLKRPAQAEAVRATVEKLSSFLNVVSTVLPDISQYSAVEDIERGVAIPAARMTDALLVTLGFGLPLVLLAYVFLKNKEVAP